MANFFNIIARQTTPSVNTDYSVDEFILNNTGGWIDNSTDTLIKHMLDVRKAGDYTYSISLANDSISGFKLMNIDGSTDITNKFFESGNIANIENGVLTLSGNIKNNLKVFADFIESSMFASCLLILITGEDDTIFYNVEQNLINCTSNISDETIKETEGKEIILTCIDSCIFDEVPTITIGDNTLQFNLNNDLTVATIIVDIIDDVVINAVARANKRVYITGNIDNATCNYSDGEFLDINKDIIISANEGYTFKSAYTYRKGVQTFEFNNYETYLKIKLREYDLKYDFYLNDDYIATREVEQLGSFVNLYKTNQTELTELSKVRFYEELGQITDYGQFITSLYVLPFNIPSDILGDKSTILLGNFDSGVESTLLATYSFDIDAGEIEVPLKYNNIYDFMNTECILHLPFLNNVYLNTEYVIGQKLSITFTIELYSGTLTANIKSSFNDEIVASVQGLVGMSIPVIQSNSKIINSISNIYKNKTNRCFIEVNRNIPYTKNNNIFGGDVVEYGRIGDYTGYIECDKIVLETNATNQEQEEIKNLLRNGVFI